MPENMLETQINKRRTFAIISHPDAGKTTLTEKLLLFGGAIQMAGAVKAKGEARRAHSDWMKVERERGISVASSVMTYEYGGAVFNLLDTPGHEDFSEDTYRVLTAVDSAVMVLDSAKGIEAQTRKLFEVCRLRDVPIITFINKLDREGLNPFALLDEIEQDLALEVTPLSWPIGQGKDFMGCYDILGKRIILMDKSDKSHRQEGRIFNNLDDEELKKEVPQALLDKLKEDLEMISALCRPFDRDLYLKGAMSPVFFGSAVNNFGVKELLDGIIKYSPAPIPAHTQSRNISPLENKVTGFVFKIQANMDAKHRDRIAFIRICSGHFKRGMKLYHPESDKSLTIAAPIMFMANDREIAEDAYAGDIVGVPNHGNLRIGNALTEGEKLTFTGIPTFAPELLQKVRPVDPLKAKHLSKALGQIAEEGGASIFKATIGSDLIVGVVGALQFEIIADRIRTEYDIPVIFEPCPVYAVRWVEADATEMKQFTTANRASMAEDYDGSPVFLARNAWHLSKTAEDFPKIKFKSIKN